MATLLWWKKYIPFLKERAVLPPWWWKEANRKQKEQVIRLLNGHKPAWPFLVPKALPSRTQRRMLERIELGLPARPSENQEERSLRKLFVAYHEQISLLHYTWKEGYDLPPDIRRCRYKRCRRFFLVRTNRPGRLACSKKCGGNYRASKSMNKKIQKARAAKLRRVRAALKRFEHLDDWKEKTALRAHVTPNFISYAIRRKELET